MLTAHNMLSPSLGKRQLRWTIPSSLLDRLPQLDLLILAKYTEIVTK